ncbi:hypothetical protein [Saccharospirillum mangrovi]|uniref:capsular polysaccharide export protein, LipB/KpsS family n=1 Tax=Saccharospirillum mangrovi TaxID=2161747 RepID=UPI000D36A01C|nr:hypothetical protein [Saccharospirillum mangrovi]
MKTALFACSYKQRQYFAQLASVMGNDGFLLWYKSPSFFLPRCVSWRRVSFDINQEIVKSANARGGRVRRPTVWLLSGSHWLRATWLYAKYRRWLRQFQITESVVWNGLKFRQRLWCLACEDEKVNVCYMENGLLPGFTTLDEKGVNYGNSVSRQVSYFTNAAHIEAGKTYLSKCQKNTAAETRSIILVPFQVNSDSQVVRYSPWIRNMADMVDVLLKIKPQCEALGYRLLVKPHPKCSTPQKSLFDRLRKADIEVVFDVGINELLPLSSAVITLNSTVGMEALIQGVPVIVLGQAFYDLPGLTLSAATLDELKVAMADLSTWQPDETLRMGFLGYLAAHYQVPGDWHEASNEHLKAVVDRLTEIQRKRVAGY